MENWIKAHCVVCGKGYEFVEGGYQPKTCAGFDCTQKFARHPERYVSLLEHLDKCRIRAGI